MLAQLKVVVQNPGRPKPDYYWCMVYRCQVNITPFICSGDMPCIGARNVQLGPDASPKFYNATTQKGTFKPVSDMSRPKGHPRKSSLP